MQYGSSVRTPGRIVILLGVLTGWVLWCAMGTPTRIPPNATGPVLGRIARLRILQVQMQQTLLRGLQGSRLHIAIM